MSLDVTLFKKRFITYDKVNFKEENEDLFWGNITHNLSDMAEEAGIYLAMWRPELIGAKEARNLIEPLRSGLELLKSNPDKFKKHNPSNGWGDYDCFVNFVQDYLSACEQYPDAEIDVSR